MSQLSHYVVRELGGTENFIIKTRPFIEVLPAHNHIIRPRRNRLYKRLRGSALRRLHPIEKFNAVTPLALLAGRYDLVYTHMLGSFSTFCTLVIAHWIRRKPYVLMDEHWYPRSSSVTSWWYRRAVAGAALIVAQSSKCRRYLIERLGADASRVTTLVNTLSDLDSQPYNESKCKDIQESAELNILCVARFIEFKGYDVLIKAFKKIERQDLCLHLVGYADNDYGRQCRRLASEDSRIVFHGNLGFEDVIALYRACDLFVLANRFTANPVEGAESFGYAVLEAAYFGLPTIVTEATGCADDVVVHGETGFQIRAADEDLLADLLASILSDRMRLQRMGSLARAHARRICSAQGLSEFRSEFETLLRVLR